MMATHSVHQTPQHEQLEQMNQINNIVSMNLSEAGVYAHPALMAYSQPEISGNGLAATVQPHSNQMSYVQYMHPAQLYARGHSVEHSFPNHMHQTNGEMAVIQPTYSMPDLNHNHQYALSSNGTALQFDSAAGLIATPNMTQHGHQLLLQHYKNTAQLHQPMYAPYPRVNSSSTPDLALQTHVRADANSSPDLVSRRNLQQSRQLDHSVDDLTLADSAHTDTGDREAINLMTSRFVQEVSASMGNPFNSEMNSYGANEVPWIPKNVSTPTYPDCGLTEHTYENLPASIEQSNANVNIDSVNTTLRTSDLDTTVEQIGFDNPAYGMPGLQTPVIDIVDSTDGAISTDSGAISQSLDVTIPLHSQTSSMSSATSSYLLPPDERVGFLYILLIVF